MDLRALVIVLCAACDRAPPPDAMNPFADNAAAATAGEALFSSMNCDGCHGTGGLGFVGPNLMDGRWRFGGSDSAVFQSIYAGRAQGMPAYGTMLSNGTIWQIIAYIRSRPVPEDIATEAWDDTGAAP